MNRLITLLSLLAVLVAPSMALAARCEDSRNDVDDDGTPCWRKQEDARLAAQKVATEKKLERGPEPTLAWETSMGFFGGVFDPSNVPFVLKSDSTTTAPGAASLAAPFGGPSLSRLAITGPFWEVRAIQSHGRFTVGLRKPFAPFGSGALDADVDAAGATARLSPRALSMWDVRFGLGGEFDLGRVTPFADVLGDLQFLSADVTLANQAARYEAATFGLSARAGLKVRLDRYLSLGVSGEYGLVGAPRWSGALTLGWVFPVD